MVLFCDTSAAFCYRFEPTLKKLREKYGDSLRVVWKGFPIDMTGDAATQGVMLAYEARAQKGDEVFWKTREALVAASGGKGAFEKGKLEEVAKAMGLDVKAAMKAVASKKHIDALDVDYMLAQSLGVYGVPHAFVNGRAISGAGAINVWEELIDDEIARADAMIKAGTAPEKVYEAFQQKAEAPAPEVKIDLAAPTKDVPTKGDLKAKVAVHAFVDLRGGFVKETLADLDALAKDMPKTFVVVWHHAPGVQRASLPCDVDDKACPELKTQVVASATLAAEASVEVFKQKGNTGFWKLIDAIFGAKEQGAWGKKEIEEWSKKAGADPKKLTAALDGGAHKAGVEADKKIVTDAKSTSGVTIVIGGHLVKGAPTKANLARAVRRALRESNPLDAR